MIFSISLKESESIHHSHVNSVEDKGLIPLLDLLPQTIIYSEHLVWAVNSIHVAVLVVDQGRLGHVVQCPPHVVGLRLPADIHNIIRVINCAK